MRMRFSIRTILLLTVFAAALAYVASEFIRLSAAHAAYDRAAESYRLNLITPRELAGVIDDVWSVESNNFCWNDPVADSGRIRRLTDLRYKLVQRQCFGCTVPGDFQPDIDWLDARLAELR